MAAAKKVTASDKQAVTKKVVTLLGKRYKKSVAKQDRPILETMIYANCLEDNTVELADQAYERLMDSFHDLNEIRVSSVREVEAALGGSHSADWRALRVRTILQQVFEKKYAFDFEHIRRKTLDLANKNLARVAKLTPFARYYTLQSALGSHLVPADGRMSRAAIWLGLAAPKLSPEKVSDALKSSVRKADVSVFCHLLRCLANEPRLLSTFDNVSKEVPEGGFDPLTAPARLAELLAEADKPARRKTTKKKVTKSRAAKSASAGKAATKKRKKAVKKKKVVKKKVAKKIAAKRGGTKKKTKAAKKKKRS